MQSSWIFFPVHTKGMEFLRIPARRFQWLRVLAGFQKFPKSFRGFFGGAGDLGKSGQLWQPYVIIGLVLLDKEGGSFLPRTLNAEAEWIAEAMRCIMYTDLTLFKGMLNLSFIAATAWKPQC